MTTKHLPLKFAVVALIAAVCIYSLYTRGLNEGIDIRGGHTLTYEVEMRLDDPPDLVQQTISLLKKRVDPQGTASLEWRPTSGNRFEVRMPAGNPESQQYKNAYDLALEELEDNNIQLSEIRRLEQASAAQRQQQIPVLARSDAALAQALTELVEAQDETVRRQEEIVKKQAELERARKSTTDPAAIQKLDKQLEEAKDASDLAFWQYKRKFQAVQATNVIRSELEAILKNYVSLGEAKALGKAGRKAQIETRTETYEASVRQLRENHPSRVKEIDAVAQLYETWANSRRPLGDPTDLKRLIAKAGVLEFRIVPLLGSDELTGEQQE